ncbi:hypothetical protein SERLA73DRAFT_139161 [Serpula lacrymans var. lacrymans S7.3]|uniref:NAD(P)-binding domain-containing protein n=2 Tax=Serpula lacrymans var. lacrymans TaxID=341189 RepID=F8Q3L9_SERL3|nr:uncharacterized protein SERLADRAFT_393216 [Serpula lacrymans var. lacrymans S7.9]EGN97104.1 hypothetical protein SERLA73DRAFT_139161 [Serpula lacrymans var. lacrymans S7.3]EGO22710.1 hypothetical protein SERLADRAFT_393216 [Serpula lacrymans var. lacrymans S7.9]
MHVLICGATGFVGKHVLLDALVDNRITKITVVARRPPSLEGSDMTHDKAVIIRKMNIIIRDDLGHWDYENDTEMVEALKDCAACIWSIGGRADDFPDPDTYERVSYTYTISAANFLCKIAQNQSHEGRHGREAQPFRFCYCSGKWADRHGKAGGGWWTWEAKTRNMKGRVEVALLSIASSAPDKFTALIFRPGGIVAGKSVKALSGITSTMAHAGLKMMPAMVIYVERVSRVLVDSSVGIRVEWQREGDGGEKKNTWESEEIMTWAVGLGV